MLAHDTGRLVDKIRRELLGFETEYLAAFGKVFVPGHIKILALRTARFLFFRHNLMTLAP
jgi:hypothetical protein